LKSGENEVFVLLSQNGHWNITGWQQALYDFLISNGRHWKNTNVIH
jgi:hypothetical protein